MRSRLNFLALPVLLFWAMPLFAQGSHQPAADLIIENAKVWTVDKANPTAQAVAVLGDRIVSVGSNAQVEAWRGPQTLVLDGGGQLLLPGFNDAHVHFISGGSQLDNVQLNDATSAKEFARRIGEKAKAMGSAYAEFQEKSKGSITAGKLADMVLLSEDITSIDPVKIRDVKVLKAIVGGKVVFDGNGAPK